MTNCRHFNGYKPCGKSEICDSLCPSLGIPGARILLVHLEALGAVMRSTALLPAIRRKYANAHITWVTSPSAAPLLQNNSMIDRVLTTSINDMLALSALQFDAALCVDKSLAAGGVLKQTQADLFTGSALMATAAPSFRRLRRPQSFGIWVSTITKNFS